MTAIPLSTGTAVLPTCIVCGQEGNGGVYINGFGPYCPVCDPRKPKITATIPRDGGNDRAVQRGRNDRMTVLAPRDKEDIVLLDSLGATQQDIADQFGVSQGHVARLLAADLPKSSRDWTAVARQTDEEPVA